MTRAPRLVRLLVLATLLTVLAAACSKGGQPGDAVEAYLDALMRQDATALSKAICPDWEAQAAMDLAAFSGVSGRLDGVVCEDTGQENGLTRVTCAGKLVLNYNGEERERSLANTTYLARRVDGEWKMCGYH
jgi:hypothetical protein